MPNLPKTGALRRLLMPALLLSAAAPAWAQLPSGATVQPQPQSTDPAELLAQALRTLATEPNNLPALTAAGRNALILGDPNAAVGFFGRAQEIAPNDGRVKAGLGSALVQLERPQDALRLFAQASRLGVPDAEFAEDRGLAYDLTGDQARAQADYRIVLAAHPEDDTARRRLALSQGISGQKAAAIATLDPLIRKRDIAGWRAQTFVLAMDGDAKGANDITRVMLPQQAAMLQPFLVRLATLSPADKARAVHFGEMPATGAIYTPTQVASVSTPATYASAPMQTTAPAPRSDLAVPVKTPPQPAPAPATNPSNAATQLAAATPRPRDTRRRPPGVTINDRDQIFALGQPQYVAAPLAGIALTPAKPKVETAPAPQPAASAAATASPPASTPATPSPTPQPALQVAQATPLRSGITGPPAPPPVELPTPAAEGHYDLPHDAATKAVGRPVPVVMKTVGTPVVHGKVDTAADEAVAASAASKKARKASVESEVARADDSGAKASRTRAGKADDDTDMLPAKGAKTKSGAASRIKTAEADDEDCLPAPKSKSRGHSRAGAKKKPSTTCTRLASAGGGAGKASAKDDGADVPSAKGAKAKSGAASRTGMAETDDEDCAPAAKSKGRGHSRASAKKKPSTACTRLASADDDSDTGTTKSRKGAKSKASAADDADDSKARSSKSAKTKDKAGAERVYVQVAGGANRDDMDKAWAGVKKKAPELMKGRSPSTTPLKATNRLLVGPFKDEDEAQAFVNKMAAKGLSGFTYKSAKGQKVEKIDTGQ